jgi:hypothetical protein
VITYFDTSSIVKWLFEESVLIENSIVRRRMKGCKYTSDQRKRALACSMNDGSSLGPTPSTRRSNPGMNPLFR